MGSKDGFETKRSVRLWGPKVSVMKESLTTNLLSCNMDFKLQSEGYPGSTTDKVVRFPPRLRKGNEITQSLTPDTDCR